MGCFSYKYPNCRTSLLKQSAVRIRIIEVTYNFHFEDLYTPVDESHIQSHFLSHRPLRKLLYILFWTQVNNVGTNIRKPTTEFTAEEYSLIMSTNFESTYHLCQLAHPLLKESGAGSIVFISSVGGLVSIGSGSIYAATKGE